MCRDPGEGRIRQIDELSAGLVAIPNEVEIRLPTDLATVGVIPAHDAMSRQGLGPKALDRRRLKVRVVDPSLRKPAPADARVYFVGLQDGSVLPQKATLRFGLVNMGVAPQALERPIPVIIIS